VTVWYFAYGSNLLRSQMYARTGAPEPGSPPPRRAWLPGYVVEFNLLGEDGKFYANIAAPGAGVQGVLYPCAADTLDRLDTYEQGYARHCVVVSDESGEDLSAITYIGLPGCIARAGVPDTAYLEKIVTGAREHGLPDAYLRIIGSTVTPFR
jgi:cation transport regulator ChaC